MNLIVRLRLTNTDSDGNPVTSRLVVTVDDERYECNVASTGTFRVPEHVGTELLERDGYAVERHTSDDDADDSDDVDLGLDV